METVNVEERIFRVYGTDYEGKRIWGLIPHRTTSYGPPDQVNYLRRYIEQGGQVYMEITSGARKGTVGRLNLTPEMLDSTCYRKLEGGYYKGSLARNFPDGIELVFDDRKQTIKIDMDWYKPKSVPDHFITFLPTSTTWVYTTTAKPKEEEWTPRDFFGKEIRQGSLVVFHGKEVETRVGTVQRWTNKGTIWVEEMSTPANPKSSVHTHNVYAHFMILLDDLPDLKAQVLLKKLGS